MTLINIETGEEIVINDRPILIGRDENANVHLNDPVLRPYQTMVNRNRSGKFVVWDLHDGTGTVVNGVAVLKALLEPGDKLMIGQTAFVVEALSKH